MWKVNKTEKLHVNKTKLYSTCLFYFVNCSCVFLSGKEMFILHMWTGDGGITETCRK